MNKHSKTFSDPHRQCLRKPSKIPTWWCVFLKIPAPPPIKFVRCSHGIIRVETCKAWLCARKYHCLSLLALSEPHSRLGDKFNFNSKQSVSQTGVRFARRRRPPGGPPEGRRRRKNAVHARIYARKPSSNKLPEPRKGVHEGALLGCLGEETSCFIFLYVIIVSIVYSKFKRCLRPMTMETRCSKVFFPNYSKKKPAEDTLVPPLWGTRGGMFCFSRIFCARCCTRRNLNLRFHVENCQHADQKQLTRR